MKKLVVLVLSLAMVFTCVGILSACGGSEGSGEDSQGESVPNQLPEENPAQANPSGCSGKAIWKTA